MNQDKDVVTRYADAQVAFEALFSGGNAAQLTEDTPMETTAVHPINDQQRAIIQEVLDARSAYCADLISSGFLSPSGFCDETESIRKLLGDQ
jgi:hypothetical protein